MIGAQTLPDFMKDLEPNGRQDKVSRRQMKIAGLGVLKETVRQAMHDELGKDHA
jgi:hypothetical protein